MVETETDPKMYSFIHFRDVKTIFQRQNTQFVKYIAFTIGTLFQNYDGYAVLSLAVNAEAA